MKKNPKLCIIQAVLQTLNTKLWFYITFYCYSVIKGSIPPQFIISPQAGIGGDTNEKSNFYIF